MIFKLTNKENQKLDYLIKYSKFLGQSVADRVEV